jgi:hypothetical protein
MAVPQLKFLDSTSMGKCGKMNNRLYFPFFLMGCCGEDRAVTKQVTKPLPKRLDRDWFGSIARLLKDNPYHDWDASSFRENILEPNKERIRIDCDIKSDKILDRVIEDCDVLLNCFYDTDAQWREECSIGEGESFGKEGDEVGFPPSEKYFFTKENVEY